MTRVSSGMLLNEGVSSSLGVCLIYMCIHECALSGEKMLSSNAATAKILILTTRSSHLSPYPRLP